MTDSPAPTSAALTVFVRAAGTDLDEMGPPSPGRFYLVLELPQGHNDMVQEALRTNRIQIRAAPPR
jgi:hypothetical protein